MPQGGFTETVELSSGCNEDALWEHVLIAQRGISETAAGVQGAVSAPPETASPATQIAPDLLRAAQSSVQRSRARDQDVARDSLNEIGVGQQEAVPGADEPACVA